MIKWEDDRFGYWVEQLTLAKLHRELSKHDCPNYFFHTNDGHTCTGACLNPPKPVKAPEVMR